MYFIGGKMEKYMIKKVFAIGLFLILIVNLPNLIYAQAGTGTGRVKGTVVDEKGNPVDEAKITASRQGSSRIFNATTNNKGQWSILGLTSGIWSFTVEKDGYLPDKTTANISQLSKNEPINFKIMPIPKGGLVTDSESRQILLSAQQLIDQKKYDEAIVEYQSFLEKNPSAYQVNFSIGNCYFEKGEYEKAIEQYEKFLQNEPEALAVLSRTAEALIKKGDLEKAIPYFEKIIEKQPDDPFSYYNIAEIYFNAGRPENAVEFYKKAVSLKPDWEKPVIKLAYAHMNLNQIERAVEYFEKYLELSPEGEEASVAKEFLKQLKPQPK